MSAIGMEEVPQVPFIDTKILFSNNYMNWFSMEEC